MMGSSIGSARQVRILEGFNRCKYQTSFMGIVDALVASVVKVISGLLGFGLFLAGGQQATFGSETIGVIMALIGIIFLVFAARL